MAKSIPQQVLERTSKPLLEAVFGAQRKVAREAAEAIFSAVVRTGSPLVTAIAGTLQGGGTSRKGRQEKVSGWLARYDFATPVREHIWREGARLVGRDTVIALDSGDISKEFGGAGMEGMEMGYDASRGVVAMGHSLLCAAAVVRRRAVPLRLSLLKGRKGLPGEETALFDAVVGEVGDNGIPVHDRGFDSERFVAHALRSGHRAVVRAKELSRDVFGTGRSLDDGMARAPCVRATLRAPTRRAEAAVRWRAGFFPAGDRHMPVLAVSSTLNGATLHLYALNFVGPDASARELREAAVLAANAYFCRWSVEVLFQDVKQCFRVEDARVRTFARLENLLAMCTLAYTYFAHVLPFAGEESRRLLKAMRDSLGLIVEGFRPFVANVRALLEAEKTRYITGRPRKAKPPDPTPFLPGFPPLA